MTQDTIKLGVEVGDNGSSKETEKKIKDLRDVVKNASNTAKEARNEIKALLKESGGTAGSRKLVQAIDDIAVYSKQRGAASLTGAAGRDFAAQAQGLDGLVRLYATYAANVFALGAAFRGLGQAMETKNMVEGLNQLGAAVGRNLGGLSKRVEELTGGAISMREAMQAVALTSSGGMSARNIERLSAVARSASLALGVSMPDAISRLSRGITKLEPELLDELGIMTRLEPATQAYARELGKTVTQLTDFERRQAFANAVLTEGEAKFGAITNLETNPYDKLISALKNLAQEGAEVLNKVLAPLANFLSQSPALLGGGALALITKIIRSAIPDIGEFKDRLSEAVNKASELAKIRANEANEAEIRMTKVARQEAENRAEAQLAAVTKVEKQIQELRDKNLRDYKSSTSVLKKLDVGGISSISDLDIKMLEATATRREKGGKKEEAVLYRDLASSIKEYALATDAATLAISKEEKALIKQQQTSKTSIAGITRALAVAAEEEAIRKSIVSNAAYNASLIGISKAAALMKEEINSSGLALSTWSKGVLVAQGYAAAFTGVLSTLGNAFLKLTNAIAYIGSAIAVFTIIDSVFAGTTKELDRFNKALETNKASAESVARTIAHLEKTMSTGTINGIVSMGNALDDLNNNIIEIIDSNKLARKELKDNPYQKIKDSISSAFGGGLSKNLSEALTLSVKNALDLLSKSSLKEETQETFKKILDINSLEIDNVRKAIIRLSDEGVKKLQEALLASTRETTNSASRLQSFKQASDSATRAYQQFIQSTSNTSPLFRVGAALQDLGVSMLQSTQSIKLGITEINAAINHIAEVPDAAVIFGTEFVEDLVEIREEFATNTKAIAAYQNAIDSLDRQISSSKLAVKNGFTSTPDSFKALEDKIKSLSKSKSEIEQSITILSEQQAEKARNLFNKGLDTAFTRGAELIRVSLGQAMEKGAIAITKATVAGLSGEERAKAENSINKQELDIQLRAIKTSVDLILSQALLRASIDKATAASNLASARQAGKSQQEIKALEAIEQASDVFYKIIKEGEMPNFSNLSRFTNDPEVINRVRVSGIADSQRLAEQNEARVLLEAQRNALGISGAINIRSGQLEDTQKLLTLQQQVIQNDSQRVNLLNNLIGLTSKAAAETQVQADKTALLIKQHAEILAIDTAIANAGSNQREVDKQKEFKALMLARHERELELQYLTSSQRVVQATLDQLSRQLELTRSINEFNNKIGNSRVELLAAENSAYNSLYGVSLGFAAIQNEITGTQKAQLDYVKIAQEASIVLYEKERKAKESIARLDATRDAGRIAEINEQLDREVKATENIIEAAKVQLETQQKILDVNKKAALQQDRYNRIMQNSTKAAESLSKAFGSIGSSLGTIAESFATMIVNSDKNFNELARIRKQQQDINLTTEARAQLEQEYNTQRRQYTQDQLASYGSIAGAAKNLFDEQSTGYRILMALEKAMYIAHVAMSLKQLAVDAMTTKASMALNVAEAESNGVVAVMKSLASLPPPLNYIAAAATAAIVAGLLASLAGAGSGPKVSGSIPGGMTAEDMQNTQGTGRTYVGGKLTDINGGALGSSTEKVNDIANSLELIENNTATSSSFAITMIDTLKDIEKNTKIVAAEAFKTTNIGKLTSGFGTLERTLPAASSGGMLGGIFPKTSKSVEIIDKGIQVIGTFSEIIRQTAQFLEYETVKTTKSKSGIFGIGAKTKVKVNTNSKELSELAQETVVDLFSSLAFAAINASKTVLGEANTQIENILQDFNISFKASGKDLTGEQFAEAILAESSVVMNEIIAKALPQFDEFRQLGEGFTSTLIRMATTMDVVNSQMSLLLEGGIDSLINRLPKLDQQIFVNVDTALNNYNKILNDTISSSLVDSGKTLKTNIHKTYLDLVQNMLDGYMPQLQDISTGFKLSDEKAQNILQSENQLAEARNNIARSLGLNAIQMVDELNNLQNAFTNAKLAILDNKNATADYEKVTKLLRGELILSSVEKVNRKAGISKEVEDLYKVTLDLQRATSNVSNAFKDQTFITMSLYNSLVEAMGGLDAFKEKTDFFFTNFYSEAEQLSSKTKLVNKSLQDFTNQGILTSDQLNILIDGTGNLREEYRRIIESQDLLSESGRQAYNTLLTFAPAIVEISDSVSESVDNINKTIEQLLDEFELSADNFFNIFSKALLSDDSITDLGGEIANTIRNGYLKAVSSSLMEDISNTFVDIIIAPILKSTVSWTDSDYTNSISNFTTFIGTTAQNAINLSNMLSNPVFNEAINQATTVATTAISKLVNTIRNTDKIFSNSKLLAYQTELLDLKTEYTVSTIENTLDVERERLDLLKEQADKIKDSLSDLKDFNKAITEFKASLLISDQSPLTPLDKYAETRRQLEDAFDSATMAVTEEERKNARNSIQQLATSFLGASREVYSSSAQYTSDFDFVQSLLDSLLLDTSVNTSVAEQQLEALNVQITAAETSINLLEEQLKVANNSDSRLEEISNRISELNNLIGVEAQKGLDSIVNSFTTIDSNLNNSLSLQELNAAGITSSENIEKYFAQADTNSDSQVSRLEAINLASNNTYYSIQSLIPILDAVSSGIISIDSAMAMLVEINTANLANGGNAISGGTTTGSTTGSNLSYVSPSGAFMSGGSVYGIAGQSSTVSAAKAELLTLVNAVAEGTLLARDFYNSLINWGADSQLVASVLGTTKAEVINWFKYYDSTIPSFAQGTNLIPEDMMVKVHKNERIIPAADNEEIINSLSNRNDTNLILIEEIKELNRKLDALQKTVEIGSIINTEATDRNTEELSKVFKESSSVDNHKLNLQKQIALR